MIPPIENTQNPVKKEIKKYNLRYAFTQQLLHAWRPRPTLKCAISIYLIIGVIFIAIGITIITMSQDIQELELRYDNMGQISSVGNTILTFSINSDIKGPIYVFYKIKGFYQNHRRYILSTSAAQLRGEDLQLTSLNDCKPVTQNKDLHPWQKFSAGSGKPLKDEDIAIPCGTAARAFFNDTYSLKNSKGVLVPISDKNISWADDRKYKFKNIDLERQWIDVTNERFINWMKISPFSTFRKTWGVISDNLPAGDYQLSIGNYWNSSLFEGEKWFILSQTNAFGGKNDFLGYTYITVGSISLFLCLVFIIRKIKRPKGITEYHLQKADRRRDKMQNMGVESNLFKSNSENNKTITGN